MFYTGILADFSVEAIAFIVAQAKVIEARDLTIIKLQAINNELAVKSEELNAKLEELTAKSEELTAKLEEVIEANASLSEIIKQFNIDKYAPSSETKNSLKVDSAKEDKKQDNDTNKNKETKPRKDKNDSILNSVSETVEQTFEFDDENLAICPECNSSVYSYNDFRTSTVLEYVPARVVKSVIKQEKGICSNCGREVLAGETNYKPLYDNGISSPSLLAQIISMKYEFAMPLYRLNAFFLVSGLKISRQLMSNWVTNVAFDYLSIIYDMLHKALLEETYIHADETPFQVIKEVGRNSTQKSYMWGFETSGHANRGIVLFIYQPGRGGKYVKEILEGFAGVVHADAYRGYRGLAELGDIEIAACWAHARRPFANLLKSNKTDNNRDVQDLASQAVEYIAKLYAIEEKIKTCSADDRLKYRQEHAVAITHEFLEWLKTHESEVPPLSKIGKAIKYCLNNWDNLGRYLYNGNIDIDNNPIERRFKGFAVGRKNWLFSFTANGAKASAICYSIVETAKRNNLKPYEYIKYLLEELPKRTTNNLEDLLPWSESMPDYCKQQNN